METPLFRFALLLLLCLSGCAAGARWDPTPVPVDIDGVWLFEYTDTPLDSMHALLTDEVAIEDGCLVVGDAVVTWVDAEISELAEVVRRVQAGERVVVSVGGGGGSLGKQEAIMDRCNPQTIWSAGAQPIIDPEDWP